MVRNIIHVSLGVVAPAVIRAANRVSFDVLATHFSNNEHGTGVLSEVRTHVLAVRIEHHRVAALRDTRRSRDRKRSRQWAVINFPTLCDDKPASRVGVGSQTIISACAALFLLLCCSATTLAAAFHDVKLGQLESWVKMRLCSLDKKDDDSEVSEIEHTRPIPGPR